jgi:WD40 repeat protein
MSTFEEAVKPAFELKKVGETLGARSSSTLGGTTTSTTCFAVNKDGTILALGASDLTTVSIFIKSDGKFESPPTFIPDQFVRSIAFHPLFHVLATGSCDGTVKLWRMFPEDLPPPSNTRTPDTSETINVESCINSVAFHPTEKLLATGSSDNTTRVWSFNKYYKELKCVATLNHGMGIDHVVNVVAFHHDKDQIFLASGCNGPNTSRLWKLNPKNLMDKPEYKILDNTDAIRTLAFHPSGKLLATGHAGHNLKLWGFNDYDSISCVNTLQGHSSDVVSVAFHPTENILATGSWDHSAKVWSYSSEGRDVKLVATRAYDTNVNSVAFYPVQKGRVPILAIGRTGGLFETYELTRPSSGVSDGGTRRRTPRRHRRRTQTRTRRRSRKQQQRSRRRRHRR